MTPRSRDLFEILVREHARMLDVFLRASVRDPALADDIFQETLIVAWKRLGDFDRERPFGPWLRGIAMRLALKARARRRAEVVVAGEEVLTRIDARCEVLEGADDGELDERLELLDRCLDELIDRDRRAIELVYRDDVRGGALAEALGTTADTARKVLQRARDRVARCFEARMRAERAR